MRTGGLTTAPLFQPVRRSRLYEDIVRQIQDLIADKHLAPGDRLPGERELADVLSVSRASVREALRVLDYLGVVEVRPGEGTFVASTPPAPLDPSVYRLLRERTFLLDVLAARRVVEDEIVRLAARAATRDDFDALEQYLETREHELAGGRQDVAGDLAFHAMLADTSGSAVLGSVMRYLNELWLRSREKTGRKETSPHKAHQYHRQVLAALRRRQTTAARQAMRRHLDDMRAQIDHRS
ncbi:MAG TPA: FadR/GntR family transcriptional regulator [bacterium]|jgi:GntR family transcriptional repressor for pyruvate dehydrogenase complex|nr:FadR/GntR family transcriptional regulator [bacterium]